MREGTRREIREIAITLPHDSNTPVTRVSLNPPPATIMSTGSTKKQANQLIDFTSTYTAQRLGVPRAVQDTQTRTDEIKQISERIRLEYVTSPTITYPATVDKEICTPHVNDYKPTERLDGRKKGDENNW